MTSNTKYTNNQTVKFILPLITSLSPQLLFRKEFLGAFVGDVDRPQWDGKILLAYEFPGTAEAVKFDKKIYNLDNYITSYDYGDNKIVIYVLDIPKEVVGSVNQAIDGYYSKIDTVDKLTISKFWLDLTNSTTVMSILDDDHTVVKAMWKGWKKDRKDLCQKGEYWFKPKFDEELFSIAEY
jgi:hypothetical protein